MYVMRQKLRSRVRLSSAFWKWATVVSCYTLKWT